MTTEIRWIRFVDERGYQDILLPPSSTFSKSAKERLAKLDKNGDGKIVYSPVESGPHGTYATDFKQVEASHYNSTADELSRILFNYAQITHHNHRISDRLTSDERQKGISQFQQEVFKKLIEPMLSGKNPTDVALPVEKLKRIHRILADCADFSRLYGVALLIMGMVDKGIGGKQQREYAASDLDRLHIAEDMLWDARIDASVASVYRTELEYTEKIDRAFEALNPILDQADQVAFQSAAQSSPYLLAARMSPLFMKNSDLKKRGTVTGAVAVSFNFMAGADEQKIKDEILQSLHSNPYRLRPSSLADSDERETFVLTPMSIEQDQVGPNDDFIYYNDPARTNRTTFLEAIEKGKPTPMKYYRVQFRVDPKLAVHLNGFPSRSFDIIPPQNNRTIHHGFLLLDDTSQKPIRIPIFTDSHVSVDNMMVANELRRQILAEAEQAKARAEINHDIGPFAEYEKLQELAEEVDRYYSNPYLNIQAFVKHLEDQLREKQYAFAISLGDNVDHVRIKDSLVGVPEFRDTNYRLFKIPFNELHLIGTEGNHGARAVCHLKEDYPENFFRTPLLQAENHLYESHYGHYPLHAIGEPQDQLIDMVRSFVRSPLKKETDWAPYMLDEAMGSRAAEPKDGFMSHYFREFGPLQNTAYDIYNARIVILQTESENYNISKLLRESKSGVKAVEVLQQLIKTIVSTPGPTPEAFVFLIHQLNQAEKKDAWTYVMGHHGYLNIFKNQDGSFETIAPEGTPFAVDSVAGTAADLMRLITWHYKKIVVLSGHVHDAQELYFDFDLPLSERFALHEECRQLFSQPPDDPKRLFSETERIYQKYNLNQRIDLSVVAHPGSTGWPGPIVEELNHNPDEFVSRHRAAFINLPNSGIPSPEPMVGNQLGYMVLNIYPDGHPQIEYQFFERDFDGGFVETNGPELEEFRREQWRKDRNWDPEFKYLTPFKERTQPTRKIELSSAPKKKSFLEKLMPPLLCQSTEVCLLGKIGLGGAILYDAQHSSFGSEAAFGLDLALRIPISSIDVKNSAAFLVPNYLSFNLGYNSIYDDLKTSIEANWKNQMTFALTLDGISQQNLRAGFEVGLHNRLLEALFGDFASQISLNAFFSMDPSLKNERAIAGGVGVSGSLALH